MPTTIDEVKPRIIRYAPVLRASHGGLTVSGGEPLLQAVFLGRMLRYAKELGLHIAVDTSGFLGARVSDTMLDDVDLVLLDVKSCLPKTYRMSPAGTWCPPWRSVAGWPTGARRSGSGTCSCPN